MRLLGERNWCLPRWLAWLPDLQVEGSRPREPEPDLPRGDAPLPPAVIPVGS